MIVKINDWVVPTGSPPPKLLSIAGTAAFTVTQAPVVLVPPPAAVFATAVVILVVVPMLPVPLVLFGCGHEPTVAAAAVVMPTVMVQLVCKLVMVRLATTILLPPALAVTLPPAQVPPTVDGVATTSPAGRVSVKLKVWVGLPVGWVTLKVRVCDPPTVSAPANALSTTGTAALTVTQAPVVLVPPPAALLVTLAVALVNSDRLPLPLVLLACGHVPTVGDAAVVTRTVIVQAVAGLTICRLVTVIVPLPAVAVTLPPLQVPPTVDGLATTSPGGRESVKLKVWVGFPFGWLTAKDRVVVPPTVSEAPNVLLTTGTAWVTTRLADAVLPVKGPAAVIAPEVLL